MKDCWKIRCPGFAPRRSEPQAIDLLVAVVVSRFGNWGLRFRVSQDSTYVLVLSFSTLRRGNLYKVSPQSASPNIRMLNPQSYTQSPEPELPTQSQAGETYRCFSQKSFRFLCYSSSNTTPNPNLRQLLLYTPPALNPESTNPVSPKSREFL